MSAILALLEALPQILALLKTLQKRIDEAGEDRKVSEDVKTIHAAFASRDPEKLNALFKST